MNDEQDAIASQIIATIEDEEAWAKTLRNNPTKLSKLAAEASLDRWTSFCDPVAHHARLPPEALASLPDDVRRQAQRAYRLFHRDPRHPSLRFKKVDEKSNVYSVRVALGYRAL